jgi:hypothetical protein
MALNIHRRKSESASEFNSTLLHTNSDIRGRFGTKNALGYLIGEKLFAFVEAAEQYSEFARELSAFVATIQRDSRLCRPPGAHEVSSSARI